jgi:hypothetical protein
MMICRSEGWDEQAEARGCKVMSENDVSQLQAKRALARLIIEMEIKDLAAIESVRAERRLRVLATLSRASGRRKRLQPKKETN